MARSGPHIPQASQDAIALLPDREREIVEDLVAAYCAGYFPMAEESAAGGPSPIGWYNPDPRGILPLNRLHISRSLLRTIRRRPFSVTTNVDFEGVVDGCAAPGPGREGTWIDDRIRHAFSVLHRVGLAHSIEIWVDGPEQRSLVGGLYGLSIGAAFFAESKFSRPKEGGTDASKVALVALVHHMTTGGYRLLDVQFWNPHIDQFGVVEIPRTLYLSRLTKSISAPGQWHPIQGDEALAAWAIEHAQQSAQQPS